MLTPELSKKLGSVNTPTICNAIEIAMGGHRSHGCTNGSLMVNLGVHQGLKVSGVLTNGSVRDLGDLSPTFPILAGSIGPSHAHVHVVDFGCPVEVLGMAVVHDTLIHADQHGAVIIPLKYLKELPECIGRIQRKEAFLLTAARSGTFDIAALEQAMLNSEDIH